MKPQCALDLCRRFYIIAAAAAAAAAKLEALWQLVEEVIRKAVAGRHSSLIAAHAIANLAAFRSGYDEVPQSRLLGAAPAPPPTPRLALASNPEVASGLAALLAEENVASASAALAALYNLTSTEGSMEALRARLKSQASFCCPLALLRDPDEGLHVTFSDPLSLRA